MVTGSSGMKVVMAWASVLLGEEAGEGDDGVATSG